MGGWRCIGDYFGWVGVDGDELGQVVVGALFDDVHYTYKFAKIELAEKSYHEFITFTIIFTHGPCGPMKQKSSFK